MVGPDGTKEKEINLSISLLLKGRLEQRGYEVAMTRTEDTGLYEAGSGNKKAEDMQKRCALIAEKKPLATISVHQNSYSDPSVCGPQVFYFAHSAEAEKLAGCLQESLNRGLEVERPRTIKANTSYYMLKRSESVAVIAECGFLSNPGELEKLKTPEYQEKVAEALCVGVIAYLEGEKQS